MRDIAGVVQEIVAAIPETWGMKHNVVSNLNKIVHLSLTTPTESMGQRWLELLSALYPIVQLPGITWSTKIAVIIAGPSPSGNPIDWGKVKTHEEAVKYLIKCPSCNTKEQIVGSALFAGRKNYYVLCLTCKERTDEFDTIADLVKFWNRQGRFEK